MIFVESPHPAGGVGFIGQESARYHEFTMCFSGLNAPAGTRLLSGIGYETAYNRNALIDQALNGCAACFHVHRVGGIASKCAVCSCDGFVDQGVEWVNIWDDDHVIPPDTLLRLLDKNVDVVVPFYIQRQPPLRPCIYKSELAADGGGWPIFEYPDLEGKDGLMPVGAAGAGGILIRRRVLEALGPKNWFEHENNIGEDMAFYRKCVKAGFQPYVALDVPIGHITPVVVWPRRDPATGRWCARVDLKGNPQQMVDLWSKHYEGR